MLEAKITETGCELKASGSGVEILAELTILIGKLYTTMYKQDRRMAAEFRKELTRALVDPEGPAWDTGFMDGGRGFMVTMPRKREG